MSDLIERLRRYSYQRGFQGCSWELDRGSNIFVHGAIGVNSHPSVRIEGTDDEQGQLIAELVGDMHEAADEIERLRAVVDAAKEYEKIFARSRTKPYSVSNELQALFDALAELEGGDE
jgi:hypothetical protein